LPGEWERPLLAQSGHWVDRPLLAFMRLALEWRLKFAHFLTLESGNQAGQSE